MELGKKQLRVLGGPLQCPRLSAQDHSLPSIPPQRGDGEVKFYHFLVISEIK